MRDGFRAAGVAALLIALLTGCTAMTGKTAGQNVDDAKITAAVKGKLAGEKFSTVTRIDVDTNLGTVYLTGNVESAAMKARAVALARDVQGVRQVVDNLRIQEVATRTPGQTIDDASITVSVKTKLAAERAATLTKVDVDTRNGIVTLNGNVESEGMRRRAAELAISVDGVRQVVNNLRIP
ncbi:MAG: BON domain-containing protein [Candidatus Rokuibacteriota bacterium]